MADTQATIYEYLTPSVVVDFSGLGTQTLLQQLQGTETSGSSASDIAGSVFTEILMLVQTGELEVDHVANFMGLAITDESKAITFCQVFDVFPQNDAVSALVSRLNKESVIQGSTLAAYLDSETLVKLDIVPAQTFNRQMNTRKRDEFFTQKKFNLLHEEYEGYSTLVSELYTIFSSDENEFLVDYAVKVVQQLIGHYLLDPNRVLDIFLDVSTNYVVGNHRFVLKFLRKSPWWPRVSGDCTRGLGHLHEGGNPAAVSSLALRLLKHNASRELPATFKILITLLIKEGFISFGSIYPYFSPSDDDMVKLEAMYKEELEQSVMRASASALALAAPIAEEEPETGTSDKTAVNQPKATVQSLVTSNFRIQMLKCFLGNGLYWPSIYILAQFPFLVSIDTEISELLHRVLASILDPLHQATRSFSAAQFKAFQEDKLVAIPRSQNTVKYEETPKLHVYCFNPTATNSSNKRLTYFVTEWAKGLPTLRSVDDLFVVSTQFLKFFGPTLADNPANFIKLCEIITADLKRDSSDDRKEIWFTYFRNYLLTSIAFVKENSIPVEKAYRALSFFTVEDRFNLYGELYQVLSKSNPHVKIAYGKAEKSTKDVLKRLSKENVEPMKRRLAKISLSNPLPCFLTILQQLESYDNLNTLVVETAAYFNSYGWDNLTLAIMMRLTSAGRSSKQANGLNERQWIQSLSSFIGKICQKYPDRIDLDLLLKYLISSLHSNGTADLIVLKEILSSMGGIQSIKNLTPLQIEMINCQPSMQKIVYKTIGDNRFELFQSGSKLREALTKNKSLIENLVLLCKINYDVTDSPSESHLKVLTSTRDEIDNVLYLLCGLVGFFGVDTKQFLNLNELIQIYKVPVVWAFELWRKFLSNSDHGEILSQVHNALSPGYFKHVNSDLYVLFWRLNLYDMKFSSSLYDIELSKLKSRIYSLKEEYNFLRKDKDADQTMLKSLKSSIEDAESLTLNIPSEKTIHEEHANSVDESLISHLSGNFGSFDKVEASAFLEKCVMPRTIHSSFDAIYSAEFIFKLHKLSIKGYSLMAALNVLFRNNVFFATLFSCTSNEAENLGIFVSAILKELNSWTQEETFLKFTHDNSLNKSSSSEAMSFAEFRKNVYEFHSIILKDVSRALEVTTYMSRMNAITFFKNLLGVYPIVEDHCEAVIELINNISKNESRDDLKLSSSALIGHVKSRKSTWVHLWDFIDMEEDTKAAQVQKRKDVEEKEAKRQRLEAERKLEVQRQEERKLQIENEARQKDVVSGNKDDHKKPEATDSSVSSISYDETVKTIARAPSRLTEAAKGRYDSYQSPSPATGSGKSGVISEDKTLKASEITAPSLPRKPADQVVRNDDESFKSSDKNWNRDASSVSTSDKPSELMKEAAVSSNNCPSGSSIDSSPKTSVGERYVPQSPATKTPSPAPPSGPSNSRSFRSTPEPREKPRAMGSSDVSSDDLVKNIKDNRESRIMGSSNRAAELKPSREVAQSSWRDQGKRTIQDKNNFGRYGNFKEPPRKAQEKPPGNPSEGVSQVRKTNERAPLPPQAAPRNSMNSRVPLPSSSSTRFNDKGPAAPSQGDSTQAKSQPSQRVPTQSSSQPSQRGNTQSASSHTASGRAPLPPQQPPKNGPTDASRSASRGFRGPGGSDDRGRGDKYSARDRRPSGDPLPPPSLPPPSAPDHSRDQGHNGKRKYGQRGWNSTKRQRY